MQTLTTGARRKPAAASISNLSFITLAMLAVLAAVYGGASLAVPRFFSLNTVSNLIAQQADLIIIGIGVTFLLVAGYIDMSVGGIISMAAVLSAWFCQAPSAGSYELARGLGLSYPLALLLTLAACVAVGAINAFFIVRMRIASVIVTLGTMAFARGIAMIVARGAQRNTGLPDVFRQIGVFTVVGTINSAVLIMLVLLVLALLVEKRTVFGRRIYLLGANQTAARLSGIRVGRELSLLYMLSALLAGITGIVMASKFNSGNCALGTGYEFDALVVTVLGGASVVGGFGSVIGTVVGAFILGILSTSVNMLGFPPSLQMLVRAVVIIAAILAQRFALDRRSV